MDGTFDNVGPSVGEYVYVEGTNDNVKGEVGALERDRLCVGKVVVDGGIVDSVVGEVVVVGIDVFFGNDGFLVPTIVVVSVIIIMSFAALCSHTSGGETTSFALLLLLLPLLPPGCAPPSFHPYAVANTPARTNIPTKNAMDVTSTIFTR